MTDSKVVIKNSDIEIRRDAAVGKVRPSLNADVAVPFIRLENMVQVPASKFADEQHERLIVARTRRMRAWAARMEKGK